MRAQVLRIYDDLLSGPDGLRYATRACGRCRSDGRWEGWIEFIPDAGRPVLRSRRETTQSDLRNLRRWAEGLGRVYLEGALVRTVRMQEPWRLPPPPPAPESPDFDTPSPDPGSRRPIAPDDVPLNPILRYGQGGESHLRTELAALAPSELRLVARAYGFAADVDGLSRHALEELIVTGARRRAF